MSPKVNKRRSYRDALVGDRTWKGWTMEARRARALFDRIRTIQAQQTFLHSVNEPFCF